MSRKLRLAESLRRSLSELIRRDVRDARLKTAMVSITHVDLNQDLSVATVYVSLLQQDEGAAIAALGSAASFLRRQVARELRLKHAPELRFHHDQSAAFGVYLQQVLHEDARRHSATKDAGDQDVDAAKEPNDE